MREIIFIVIISLIIASLKADQVEAQSELIEHEPEYPTEDLDKESKLK